MKKISRAKAKVKGLKRFFTGKPCKYGHTDERYASSSACVSCNRLSMRAHARTRTPEQRAERKERDHGRNTPERRAKRRERWRARTPEQRAERRERWRRKYHERVSVSREKARRYRKTHREYFKAYYKAHPEKWREYARRWRKLHPLQKYLENLKYRKLHPERKREAKRRLRESQEVALAFVRKLERETGINILTMES